MSGADCARGSSDHGDPECASQAWRGGVPPFWTGVGNVTTRPVVGSAQKPRTASGGRQRDQLRSVFAWGVAALCLALGTLPGPASVPPRNLDPAAWGSDHVGKAVPESITGDECLFCHRLKIGPAWPQNRHQSTIRRIDPEAVTLLKTSKSLAPFAEVSQFVL